jgi:hypothetical protein
MNTFEFSSSTKTLRQRLSDGKVPVQDGLRYAALLAETLRALHESGRAHGGVTPEAIVLTSIGLDLLPPVSGPVRVTPYTAPEIAGEQKPADTRSDIFSFGAILFEILTGRKAFEGDSESALVTSLCASPAPPSGNPPVDRVLAGCLAKNPDDRWQLMQKIQLELKLLIASARRTAPPLTDGNRPAGPSPAAVAETSMRIEMAQLEARVNARLASYEQSMAQIQIAVSEAITGMRGQLSTISMRLSTAQTAVGISGEAGQAMESAAARLAGDLRSEMQEHIDHLSRRIAYVEQGGVGTTVAPEEISRVEAGLDRVRRDLRELHENMAADFHEFELNLKAQANAIESARTAMAQTDELVERVVEALDTLQSQIMVEEDHMMAAR